MASAQLQLIHTDHAWKLDRRTVQVGRAGVAQARAALAAATRATLPLTDGEADPADTSTSSGNHSSNHSSGHRAAA